MAVCEIWDVRGRLEHSLDYVQNAEKTENPAYTKRDMQTLQDVMRYATNGRKTERQFFVSGIHCKPETARQEMQIVKQQFDDQSKIVCYHGYQSFRHGEVTPQLAHEIGVKLAQSMWGDRFQVIVATHLNTGCFHNHFVINSISFVDGRHYHDNKANLRLLRQKSDELCREYSLSVLAKPQGHKQSYALYQEEKQGLPTRNNTARQAVEEAVSKSFTLHDFERNMAALGYECRLSPNRTYWTILGEGWKRPKRLYQLGLDYTNERHFGTHSGKQLYGSIFCICRTKTSEANISGQRRLEVKTKNRRLAWLIFLLLLSIGDFSKTTAKVHATTSDAQG